MQCLKGRLVLSHRVSVSYRAILALAAPVSLSLFLPQISFFTNTAFLGQLGEQELGVNGVAGIFYLLLQMIGYGFATGLQTQLSRRSGEVAPELLGKTLANGFWMSGILSLALLLLAFLFSPLVFQAGMKDPVNVELATRFLRVRMPGLLPLLLLQVFQAFFLATGQTRVLVVGSAVLVATNVVFDYLLIFGKAGFPAMGLNGAALASVLAEVAELLALALLFFSRKQHRKYRLRRISFRPDAQLMRNALVVGAPLMVQYAFSIGGWEIFFLMIEHLGARALAASQILRSIFGLLGMTTWAFATVASAMVSNLIGQGRQQEVMLLIGKIARISFTLTAALVALLLLFGRSFLSLYRNDPVLVSYAMPSLYVIVLAALVLSVATVYFNGVVGTGNTQVSMLIEVVCVCLYLAYCLLVVRRPGIALHWAWAADFVYWSGLLLFSVGYLLRGKWKGKVI